MDHLPQYPTPQGIRSATATKPLDRLIAHSTLVKQGAEGVRLVLSGLRFPRVYSLRGSAIP